MDQVSDPMDWDPARTLPEAFVPRPAAPAAPLSELRVIGETFKKKEKHFAPLRHNQLGPPRPTTIIGPSTASASRSDRGFGSSSAKPKSKLSKKTLQANLVRKYPWTTREVEAAAAVGRTLDPLSGIFSNTRSAFEIPVGTTSYHRDGLRLKDSKGFIRNAPKRDPCWLEPYRLDPNAPKISEPDYRAVGEQVFRSINVSPVRKRSHETFAGNDDFATQGNQFRESLPGAFPADTPPSSPQQAAGHSDGPTFLEIMLPKPIQRGDETVSSNLSNTPRPPPQRASDSLFGHIVSPSTMRIPAERQGPINMTDRIHNIAAACLSTLGSIYTVAVQSATTARRALQLGGNVAYKNRRHVLSAGRATMDVTAHTYRAAVHGAGSFKRRLIEFTVSAQRPLRPSPSGVSSARQPRNTGRRSQRASRVTATNPRDFPVVNGLDDSGSDVGSLVDSDLGDALDDVPQTPRASPRYVESFTPPGYHPPSPFLTYDERHRRQIHRRPNVNLKKYDLLVRLADTPNAISNLNSSVAPASLATIRKDIRKVQKHPSKKYSATAQRAAEAYLNNKIDDSEIYSSPVPPRLPLVEMNSNAPSVTTSPIVREPKSVHFYESPNTGKPVNDVRYIEEDSTADTSFDFSSDLSSCSEDGSLELEEHEEKFTGPISNDKDESLDNCATWEVSRNQNSDDNAATTKSVNEHEEQFTGSLGIDTAEAQDNGAASEVPRTHDSDDYAASAKSEYEHEEISTGPLGIDKTESQDGDAALEASRNQNFDDTAATTKSVEFDNKKEVEGAMPVKADNASTSPISNMKDEVKDAGSPLSIIPPIIPALKRLGISNRRADQRTQDALDAERRKEEAAAISAQIAREQKEDHERMLKVQAEAKAKQKREKADRMKQDANEAWLAKMHRKAVPAGTTLFQPLSAEWQLKVTNAMDNSPNVKVATISTGTPILRSDFGTVLPSGPLDKRDAWLNDTIIEAYLQLGVETALKHVKHRRGTTPRYHAFTPFFYKVLADKGYPGVSRWAKRAKISGQDLLKVEYVIVPINPSNHWTVMVISPLHKTIEYFDSLSSREGTTNDKIELGKEWLRGELGAEFVEGEWTTKIVAGPKQENTSDCGVFAVTTARLILFGWDPKGAYHAGHIPQQRRKMLAELMKGALEGEFAPVWAWGDE
ncbi:Smt3-specific protease [Xylographa pallens]|nr:Smt3-specific protease [Xylographa pallens]